MKRFYSQNIQTTTALLEGKEKEHCTKVLRTQIGEAIEIVDGNGNLYLGELAIVNKQNATVVNLVKQDEIGAKPKVSLAICIPKNPSRWEWFLEKATEIGIDEIYPLIAKRSEKKRIRYERNLQIIVSAFKQSGQLYLPKLKEPILFNKFMEQARITNQNFIAHCEPEDKTQLSEKYKKGEKALILIGPEGDFSKEEITLALSKGFEPISLGNSRLRVETAGIVATGIVLSLIHI